MAKYIVAVSVALLLIAVAFSISTCANRKDPYELQFSPSGGSRLVVPRD